MNTKNNLRFQQTENLIKETFIKLLNENEINRISISKLCKLTYINRTTFYLHYIDIYDLMAKIEAEMSEKMLSFFLDNKFKSIGDGFIQLFYYIKENQDFYRCCFRDISRPDIIKTLPNNIDRSKKVAASLGFSTEKELIYHEEFFKAGLSALIKVWLSTGCIETPEELGIILHREYSPQMDLFQYH